MEQELPIKWFFLNNLQLTIRRGGQLTIKARVIVPFLILNDFSELVYLNKKLG
jgi:hypothetical protein